MQTMTFPARFKVSTYTASTKDGLLRFLSNGFVPTSDGRTERGSVLRSVNRGSGRPEFYRLYRLQKFNKKSVQTQKVPTRGKNKGRNISTSIVLRRPHWIATYIDVPTSMVKKVAQYNRTFTLEVGA